MAKFLHEFLHYSNGEVSDNGWWEIVDNRLYNRMGGYHDYYPSPDDIIMEANRYEDLDWSFLIKPESDYGWVTPDGEFLGCDYQDHDNVAWYCLKHTEYELEKMGYAKVFKDFSGERRYWVDRHLTEQQEQTLINLGVKL